LDSCRLNNSIYDNFANLTEKMALFNMEADLRSQVIAQVVQDLNRAAAEEIRSVSLTAFVNGCMHPFLHA
jgi:hypothetical protein